MPRDKGAARQLRSRIAHLAARMMAEDGVDDFALAKRKAARQVHASEIGNLPTNDEVKAELPILALILTKKLRPIIIGSISG